MKRSKSTNKKRWRKQTSFDVYSLHWLKRIGVFLFLLMSEQSFAQDIQFSQFYANVLYLNPAFAGSAYKTRAIFHERLQWPNLDAKYITTSFSLDHNFERYNSGVGVMVLKDWQGANTISSTEMALQYAYEATLSSVFSLRLGVESKYVSRYINYSYLTLPDQYNNNGFSSGESMESFGKEKINYLDLSAGTILYSDFFWVGIASNHLTRPNQSLYTNGEQSRLPMKLDVTSGVKFHLKRKRATPFGAEGRDVSVIPTAHYKSQGKSDQVDAGIYCIYGHVLFGGWYRGIPLLKQYRPEVHNNESMVGLLGWQITNLSISYSYDFTVSKLERARTGGSHELNITYVWDYPKNKKRKPMKRLPCPDFFD